MYTKKQVLEFGYKLQKNEGNMEKNASVEELKMFEDLKSNGCIIPAIQTKRFLTTDLKLTEPTEPKACFTMLEDRVNQLYK